MQFYRDGFRPGDPDRHPAADPDRVTTVHEGDRIDVLIVGTGPAGTVLGAQLAQFPGIDTRIVEQRRGPLELGQADGVAVRTVEMFNAFGLAEALLREAHWVNEVKFWGPKASDRTEIERTGWVEDTPEGLSEFPHVIVNQARMQEYLLELMRDSAARLEPDYGVELVTLEVDDDPTHPVLVTARRDGAEELRLRARYVAGGDGARSSVRRAIGRRLQGDAANHAWGVMDALAVTDFPDFRNKSIVQSDGKGSLLTIPREGGNLVRCYIDLGTVPEGDDGAIRRTPVERLVEVANDILHPYSLDVREVAWSSVYEVGQRVADGFDDVAGRSDADPRVFIMGDACHTHSAKAGQGMNVSMQDGFNLGWKLAAVLRGQAAPSLLKSYSAERQTVAEDLIDFDRHWSAFIAQPALDPARPELGGVSPAEMEAEFARQGRYTAGLATRYTPSALTGDGTHQALATGFEIGTRLHSAPVVRVADGRRTQLGHVHRADGRWRLYAFEDRDGRAFRDLAEWLTADPAAPTRRFAPEGAALDAVVDVIGVVQSHHHEVDPTTLPGILLPRSGALGLQDWEKVYAPDFRAVDVFDARGISRDGAVVVVRPDQHVATVLPLTARAELSDFFAGFMLEG